MAAKRRRIKLDLRGFLSREGISVKRLADECGQPRQVINKWCSATAAPRRLDLDKAEYILRALFKITGHPVTLLDILST